MTTKQIAIPTNYNNKLSSNVFLHIDAAPKDGVPETVLKNTVVVIATKDGSHPPVHARLVDLSRCPLYNLSSVATWASHGVDQQAFVDQFVNENANSSIVHAMAIYIYQKI